VPAASDRPERALAAWLARLRAVEVETLPLARAAGRVLAAPIHADRPSPPCDVAAMDGYAVRAAELAGGGVRIAGRALPGAAAPACGAGEAVEILTGAPLPPGADTVVPHEQARAREGLLRALDAAPGRHVRRRGENASAGAVVVPAGRVLGPAALAAASHFGAATVAAHRPVRVGVLVTGDEIVGSAGSASDWQVRDALGPSLVALLADAAWLDVQPARPAPDEPEALTVAIGELLGACDALVVTGGVSAGARDHVPAALERAGVEAIFHGLAVRPGKPVLGGVGPQGQPVLALPGNPVAALVLARRLALPALRRRGGSIPATDVPLTVSLTAALDPPGSRTLWHLARIVRPGMAELVSSQGPADVPALARSDGFVEQRPDDAAPDRWAWYPWSTR
jgi:molybdopterin molybdotransferase